MVQLIAAPESITAPGCAHVIIDTFSEKDPRFTAEFWQSVFLVLINSPNLIRGIGTRLTMSMSDLQKTHGQTERVNRVLEKILRGYIQSHRIGASFYRWSNLPSTIRCMRLQRIYRSS